MKNSTKAVGIVLVATTIALLYFKNKTRTTTTKINNVSAKTDIGATTEITESNEPTQIFGGALPDGTIATGRSNIAPNPVREDPYIPTYTPPSRSGGGTYVPPYVESINTVLDPIVRQPVREDPYIPTYTNPSYSSGGGVSGTIRGINSVVRGIEKPKLMM